MAINFNQLGVRMDGWADIVQGVGEKAQEAQAQLEQIVRGRQMPAVTVNPTIVTTTSFGNRQRPYLQMEMPNGASIIVYIGAFGRDLYATWESYLRPVFNTQVVYIALGVAAVMSFLGNADARGFNFFGWIMGAVGWLVGEAILLGLAGQFLRGNPLAFLFKQLDKFDADDIGAMTLAVHQSVLQALDCVGIQSQTLRLKEQFRAGSRERLI